MTPEEKLARKWGALADEAHGCRQPNYVFLLEAATAFVRMGEAFKRYVAWHQGAHTGVCSMDDTCDCAGKPINEAVNAALAAFDAHMKEQA